MKIQRIALALVLFLSSFAVAYSGGSGTEATPYQIATKQDLLELGANTDDYDKYFIMTADIDLSSETFTRALIAWDTDTDSNYNGTAFTGTFNGDGHVISNLTVNGAYYCGLFGYIASGGIVSNLGLENASITGTEKFIGGLCGWNYEGSITSCYTTGSVIGRYSVGGICGYNDSGSIITCYSTGSVAGYNSTGGLCGNNLGSISQCYATGSITGDYRSVGGLCGSNSGSLSQCYATGSVSGDEDYSGGLCGSNSGSLSQCYATGSVSGDDDYSGGLCGSNSGSISQCYATGSVTGVYSVGGLCGYNRGSIITCYAAGSVFANDYVGGLCGNNINNISDCFFYIYAGFDNGFGLPLDDVELQQKASFVGFDFTNDGSDGTDDCWAIENGCMPRLSWQEAPGFSPPYRLDNISTSLSGSGYADDPFIISNYDDLMEFRNNSSLRIGYYSLSSDIDLAGVTYTDAFVPETFWGVFQGNGHEISNLVIDGDSHLGFFCCLYGNIYGLGLKNVSVTGISDVGGLCGWNYEGSITSCYTTGSVIGRYSVGGICGYNRSSIISCYLTGSVTGKDSVGGLCGYYLEGNISSCYATGSVIGRYSVGGLCGNNRYGIITNSYATGNVTGDDTVGGLFGYNDGNITNCYATGAVTGNSKVGGLCGYNYSSISQCYATGDVYGNKDVGGLCGYNSSSANISSCFFDTDTTGQEFGVGSDQSSDSDVTGLTTSEMQSLSTFTGAGWDFDGDDAVWKDLDGWYPILVWQNNEIVTVPDFSSLTFEQAEVLANSYSISVVIADYYYSNYYDEGLVCSQQPAFGSSVPDGIVVKVNISLGPIFSGGAGTELDPYLITTADDLISLGENTDSYDKYFILTADIDLSGETFTHALIADDTVNNNYSFDGTKFTGSFNGNGHVISNLTVSGTYYCGLFGYIGSGGSVSNLGLENVSISGTEPRVGGLCGMNMGGNITSCYATGTVAGDYNYVGGLCGANSGGSITSCYAAGSVSGSWHIGGLCGANSGGSITSCYAAGSVSGSWHIGGLCGTILSGNITSCYATSEVSGNNFIGGLCGKINGGSVTASYYNINICGYIGSDGGWPVTDDQMKQSSSFYGWTSGNWTIDEGNDYPRLIWENTDGIFINTDYPAITYSGAGTESDPFQINSADDLQVLMYRENDWDKHYVLISDIDLAGIVFYNPLIGYGSHFTGFFDGSDGQSSHVVSNLTISGNSNCGLFGYISSGGGIANLGLENVSIKGAGISIGGMCGYNDKGSITSCYVTGSVTGTGDIVGGLCGYNYSGIMTSCYSDGSVTGLYYVGGLAGASSGSCITDCYSTSDVSGKEHIGGMCGCSDQGSITSCYATGNVAGDYDNIGGLCGSNYEGSITSCYATGNVSGNSSVGGLCGSNYEGSITSCYATGNVAGDYDNIGGFCGYQYGSSAKIMNCFWDVETSGFGSSDDNNYGATGKTTAEMQALSTFTDADWDFSNDDGDPADWQMVRPGEDYPRLAWQQPIPGDIAGLWGVDIVDLQALLENWLSSTSQLGDINNDSAVNLLDFASLANNWLEQ